MQRISKRMSRLAPGLMVASALLYSGCGKQRATKSEQHSAPSVPAKEAKANGTSKRKRSSGFEPGGAADSRRMSDSPRRSGAGALEQIPEETVSEVSNELALRDWIERDPAGAAAWAAQATDPKASILLRAAAATWASTDLNSALNWLQQLPESDAKSAATMAVAYETARSNPTDALRLAVELPASAERDNLLAHTVSQWAEKDPNAAIAWAKEVPDAPLRQQLLAAVAIAQAEKDGAAAATLVSTALPTGPEQERAAVSVVQSWAQSAPHAAAEWVLQFPSTPTRTSAVRSLIAIWTALDATSAAHWLKALPPGPDREAAESAYAQAINTGDFESV